MAKDPLESKFNEKLNQELKRRFPDHIALKLNANQLQGVPDRLVLYGNKWATLESKRAEKAKRQPNQEDRVAQMDEMGFSAFIYPANCDEVLDALELYFKPED